MQFAGFEGSTSIRGDVDVRGTILHELSDDQGAPIQRQHQHQA